MNAPSRPPRLIATVAELREALEPARRSGQKIGLVPTMGALHEGHLSLVRACRAECDLTVVSIYVNPSQFGPTEDFARYPRTLQADLELLAGCGAEIAFAPSDAEVYPDGYATWVEVGSVARPLEGECRPGHFRGVATIVLKLLNMVGPQIAYFGQKDYQQALVIRRLVRDLNVPTTIRLCPIVREPDGLAMSSRNRYLAPEERKRAAVLYTSLCLAKDLLAQGQTSAPAIAQQMQRILLSAQPARIDYIALVDPETLQPVQQITGPTLAALAVVIGQTRLIDNSLLEPPAA
ncbi:MAG: pantoate--beta-alanine ligase [Thermoguttaceae bacterium]